MCVINSETFLADHRKVADMLREAKYTQRFQVDQIGTTRQR